MCFTAKAKCLITSNHVNSLLWPGIIPKKERLNQISVTVFYCVTERSPPINDKIHLSAVLREDTLSGNPPFKAAFVGAPGQWGFARHGRGLRRVRGMRRRSFASEGSRERSEAPEGAARRRAHAHRMPCRLSGRPSKPHPSLRPQIHSPA